jgi:hypothetical protein
MSIKYDSKRESLSEIVDRATVNATYVIPDLQRPYVWTPRQVTMLVDSLFRGWPFGSLLLWEVKPNCFKENEGIPHRAFWQEVDRTGGDDETAGHVLGQPATYQMVLDGQQRVQSLVLALGGDQWGFKLFDSEWALDLQDRRVRPSEHWSKASLCVDLQKFCDELKAKNGKARKIEAGKILEWVVLDQTSGRSPEPRPNNYVDPLHSSVANPGRFIRLSRLWNLVQQNLSESEYRELLTTLLAEHAVHDLSILYPLAEYLKVIEGIKITSSVHALQIESFELTPQWSKDDYSDAIVNIFTRLNTAGRTLTREDITLAWLKVGWMPQLTEGKTAGRCLDELKTGLIDLGFTLETDEIVRLIAFVWAVEHRQGNLLDSKDLLKGDVVRSMAADVATSWTKWQPCFIRCAELIKKRGLLENQGSFNAVIVFICWYGLVTRRMEQLTSTSQVLKKDDIEKKLNVVAERFLDRWIFSSQWANMWGEGAVQNFQNFASDLSIEHSRLSQAHIEDAISVVEGGVNALMSRVAGKASEQVLSVLVRDRRRVHQYFPYLWVWHRLRDERWTSSSIPMREARKRTSKLEVDHSVADAAWKRMVEESVLKVQGDFEGSDEDRAKLPPEGFQGRAEALAFINLMGNCSLLEKSFNISKSDKPMRTFLGNVHEFKEGKMILSEWEAALFLSDVLNAADGRQISVVKEAIEARDLQIRRDLVDFVDGVLHRVDVSV